MTTTTADKAKSQFVLSVYYASSAVNSLLRAVMLTIAWACQRLACHLILAEDRLTESEAKRAELVREYLPS